MGVGLLDKNDRIMRIMRDDNYTNRKESFTCLPYQVGQSIKPIDRRYAVGMGINTNDIRYLISFKPTK